MRTEKQKFMDYLKRQDYNIGDGTIYAFTNISPHHRVSPTGTHTILYHIACVLFEGIDTKSGDLGCTTFCFYGRERRKHKKTTNNAEILKKCITCDTAAEAIEEFETWRKNSWTILHSWTTVI